MKRRKSEKRAITSRENLSLKDSRIQTTKEIMRKENMIKAHLP